MIKNYPLKKFTSMGIGGPAKYFVVVRSEKELIETTDFATQNHLKWYVLGEGSNMVVSDKGFGGLIIQNKIQRFNLSLIPSPFLGEGSGTRKTPLQVMERGKGRGRRCYVMVGAGNNLLKSIRKINKLGFAGFERMAGIPGTVGGAIYGCAGAYGQEIRDNLLIVRIFDGKKFRSLTKKRCQFGYRRSIFKKHKNWIITEATFRFKTDGRPSTTNIRRAKSRRGEEDLAQISRQIIRLRQKKYKPGLKCPGSFFKNIKLADLPAQIQRKLTNLVPPNKVAYGKIPAGHLLEEIGAKGMQMGSIRVAKHHGNLIYNPDGGRATDVRMLAKRLKALVKNKFGITIEEEVQYLY